MAYKYQSRRSAKRLARQSKRNFIITLFIIVGLTYATIQWILPTLISGIGFINSIVKPPRQVITPENSSLAPPVLNIPYQATNTAQIDIRGFATPLSKVKVYLDDEAKHEAEVSSDGSFIIENVSLVLGTNNIYGKTVDEKEEESLPSKTIRVLYDNEKPFLNISEPEDGKKVQGERKLRIAGKTEPGSRVFINGNQTIVDKNGNFSTEQLLNDGDNNFNIRAEDLAANSSEVERSVSFTP